jgi:malonyl-CoA/methylmalonyl-CoA synthetase
VVTTHANIESQIRALVTAWEWEEKDHILNILPLHHVHGIINVLSCALWSGACCEFLPKFDASDVWSAILARKLTLFMAVPTIYYKLIEYWESASQKEKTAMAVAAKTLRLMVSGSAALPVPVMDKWKTITGQTLLERYGMTEIGMALSNPYRGKRQAGHVGLPLPNVEVRLADSENNTVAPGEQGEIQVKGPSVFMEYWRNEKATADAFTVGGWFKTGDIAVFDNGAYKILGRDSVDIIKSGGYKISALEIEDVLRKYPGIADCAVVGLADEAWGEIVAAFIVTGDLELDEKALTNWLKERLPAYKIPRKYVPVVELPRNVLGKVTKNELKKRS